MARAFVSLATAIVIVAVAVALFFNPLWIAFEQERSGVPAITGYTSAEVNRVTGSILADLFFGPPTFGVAVNGEPVLGPAERSHMTDVRNVLLPVTAFAIVVTVALVGTVAANRRQRWVWQAVGCGALVLAVVGVIVGAAALLFFDKAFLLFHLIFFPQGNFSFDPRVARLTQLFPEQFWTESTIGIVIVGLAIAIAVTVFGGRAASRGNG